MRGTNFFLIVLGLAFFVAPMVEAQSPEMPEPLAIVVDADGKPMVQVVDIDSTELRVLFEFDNVPTMFRLLHQHGRFGAESFLVFTEDNCEGDAYLSQYSESNALASLYQRVFFIVGPDPTAGTYQVLTSTSPNTVPVLVESSFSDDGSFASCQDVPGSSWLALPIEVLIPNPLEGFHGPTVANPERLLTVKGGTRLP